MLNFKKLASTFIFSILAFQSTACAVPRYAKVVLLGGKGSGKTTIQKLINKDYDISNIPHTTQISYISVPVFYDNKGNFTFDEDRDVQRYNKEVILNICDTPAINGKEEDLNNSFDEDKLDEITKFALKKPNVLVFLADGSKFNFDNAFKFMPDYSLIKCFGNFKDCDNVAEMIVLTNSHSREDSFLVTRYLKNALQDDNGDQIIDVVKVLTLCDDKIKEENKKTGNKIEKKCTANDSKLAISREINLEYTTKMKFNKNTREDLKKYADVILNSIAQLVYKYGIDNLEFDNNASDWSIINGKLVKGH